MPDDTEGQVTKDVTGLKDVLEAPEAPEASDRTSTHEAAASPLPPSRSKDAGNDGKSPTFASPTAPSAIGKHAIETGADEVGENRPGEEFPPRKKARKASASTSSSAEDSASTPNVSSQSAAPGIAIGGLRTSFAQPVAAGLTGIRTSFGTTSQKLVTKDNVDFLMHNPLTIDERSRLIAAAREYEVKDVKPLNKRKLNWTFGPIRPDFLVGSTWLEIWESTIDKWCGAFLIDNQANIAQVGLAPSLLKMGFQRRLDVEGGEGFPSTFKDINDILLQNPDTSRLRNFASEFKPDHEKMAKKQARIAAKTASAGSDNIESSTADDQQTNSRAKNAFTPTNPADTPTIAQIDVDQDGESATGQQQNEVDMEEGEINSGDASGVEMTVDEDEPPISPAEIDQRHRYFPNIPDSAVFCLTCAQVGHSTASCPDLTCKFCQGAHFKYECPTRHRCAKCKQLGHMKRSCPEKLAVAAGEVIIECAICEGHDHTEINCIQLYQIYRPKPGNVSKVRSLPVFCYACGTEGHYGGDCSLADPSVPPTKVWTMSTASLYIDPGNDKVALSYRNELPAPPEVTRPIIPGRSIKPQTHVIFEESDGEGDGDFISTGNVGPANRNKRTKRSNNGPAIQIASNISFGGNAGAGPSSKQQIPQQQQPPKKQKGPAQPPKKSKKPGNDALPGTKIATGRRNRNKGPPPPVPQSNFTSVRTSQPPPRQNQGSGGRGGGNAGRGGGGFSQLNNKRPRRARRGQGGGGGGAQN